MIAQKVKLLILTTVIFSATANAELVVQYKFDGNTLDSSGNGYHLVSATNRPLLELNGTLEPVVYKNDTYNGIGQSADFNNYTALAMDKFYDQVGQIDAMSFSIWFNTSHVGNDPDGRQDWTGTSHDVDNNPSNWALLDFDRSEFFSISLSAQGNVAFSFLTMNNDDTKTINDITSNRSSLNDNQWHHAYISYGVTNGLQISIDGDLDLLVDYKGAIGSGLKRYGFVGDGSESEFFDDHRNIYYYDGMMDELSYWNDENGLSLAELDNIALLSSSISASNLSDVPVSTPFGALIAILIPGSMLFCRRRQK